MTPDEKDQVPENSEAPPASEVTASNTSESDVASESIVDASAEVAELEAEAATAEAPDAEAAEKSSPRPQRAPRKKPETAEEPVAEEPPATRPPAPRRAAPAPRRSRTQREPGQAAPVVRAQAKYVRSSARKARLVCDNIRGKSVEDARAILAVTPRAVARDWSKLLESAVANAEHNHELVGEDLYIKVVQADEGPTIKRFRPRAMGRATKIRKRTAHLTILLTPKD
jgi:ribosomal protein L22